MSMKIEQSLNSQVKPTVEEQIAEHIVKSGEFTTVDKERIKADKDKVNAEIAPLDFSDER